MLHKCIVFAGNQLTPYEKIHNFSVSVGRQWSGYGRRLQGSDITGMLLGLGEWRGGDINIHCGWHLATQGHGRDSGRVGAAQTAMSAHSDDCEVRTTACQRPNRAVSMTLYAVSMTAQRLVTLCRHWISVECELGAIREGWAPCLCRLHVSSH